VAAAMSQAATDAHFVKDAFSKAGEISRLFGMFCQMAEHIKQIMLVVSAAALVAFSWWKEWKVASSLTGVYGKYTFPRCL
jgi:membrane associated rhomboid family serine protease